MQCDLESYLHEQIQEKAVDSFGANKHWVAPGKCVQDEQRFPVNKTPCLDPCLQTCQLASMHLKPTYFLSGTLDMQLKRSPARRY